MEGLHTIHDTCLMTSLVTLSLVVDDGGSPEVNRRNEHTFNKESSLEVSFFLVEIILNFILKPSRSEVVVIERECA